MYRFFLLLYYQLVFHMKQGGSMLNTSLFYLIITSLFPLSMSRDTVLIEKVSIPIISITFFLTLLILVEGFFEKDKTDGSFLEYTFLSNTRPYSINLFGHISLVKMVFKWFILVLSISIVIPFIFILLNIDFKFPTFLSTFFIFLVASPSVLILCVTADGLLMTFRSRASFISLLVMPLNLPILLFMIGYLEKQSTQGHPTFEHSYIHILFKYEVIVVLLISTILFIVFPYSIRYICHDLTHNKIYHQNSYGFDLKKELSKSYRCRGKTKNIQNVYLP
uniref:ABC transporter channel subunit n=1 Tax=Moramonas marocensis TaxID=1805496 RepID=A0A140F2I8_9EUKA|nr:ABC transporter channel subunit [Moramonas marocensis]